MVTEAVFQPANAGAMLLQLARYAEKRQQPVGDSLPPCLRPSQDGFDGGEDVGRCVPAPALSQPLIGEYLKDSVGFGQIMLGLRLIGSLSFRCFDGCSLAHEGKINDAAELGKRK